MKRTTGLLLRLFAATQFPDVAAATAGHQSAPLDDRSPWTGPQQLGYFRCTQRRGGAQGQVHQFQPLAQRAQVGAATVFLPVPDPGALVFGPKPSHQPQADQGQGLIRLDAMGHLGHPFRQHRSFLVRVER